MPMTVMQPPLQSADEIYDEHEAKHRFAAALRSARRKHDQRQRGPAAAQEEEYAHSSRARRDGNRS
jgi:hypothetical protein